MVAGLTTSRFRLDTWPNRMGRSGLACLYTVGFDTHNITGSDIRHETRLGAS